VPDGENGGKADGTSAGRRFRVIAGGRHPRRESDGKTDGPEGGGEGRRRADANGGAFSGDAGTAPGLSASGQAECGEGADPDRAAGPGDAGFADFSDSDDAGGGGETDHGEDGVPRRSRMAALAFRLVAIAAAVALVGQVAAALPHIYNVNVLRLLSETREWNRDERVEAYKAAIVVVEAEGRKGTGFNVDERGLIVTNRHVVGDSRTAVVAFGDGRVRKARVVADDEEADLAALVPAETSGKSGEAGAAGERFPALALDAGSAWSEGDDVFYIGNPLFFRHLAGRGTILGLTGAGMPFPVLLIEAPVYPGNSGSPVITGDGRVIGVIYASAELEKDGRRVKAGLAIPADHPFFAELAGVFSDR